MKTKKTSFPFRKKVWMLSLIFLLVGLVALGWLFFRGEKSKKIITIGISRWTDLKGFDDNIRGFKDELKNSGYIENQNIQYLLENPQGNSQKQREIIQSFIDKKVDLIYTLTTDGTLIAKEMTKDIPIVFSVVTYPVETGVVDSLESSGNNLVGTRNYIPSSKQYFNFEKLFPNTKALAFLHVKDNPDSIIQLKEMETYLKKRNIEVLDLAIEKKEDVDILIQKNLERIDSIFVNCDIFIKQMGGDIVTKISDKYKKPTFTCGQAGVRQGILSGTVVDLYTIGKISGEKAVAILRGADPSWLLTEAPREDYIMINTNTCKNLNVPVKEKFLEEADEVVGK